MHRVDPLQAPLEILIVLFAASPAIRNLLKFAFDGRPITVVMIGWKRGADAKSQIVGVMLFDLRSNRRILLVEMPTTRQAFGPTQKDFFMEVSISKAAFREPPPSNVIAKNLGYVTFDHAWHASFATPRH